MSEMISDVSQSVKIDYRVTLILQFPAKCAPQKIRSVVERTPFKGARAQSRYHHSQQLKVTEYLLRACALADLPYRRVGKTTVSDSECRLEKRARHACVV